MVKREDINESIDYAFLKKHLESTITKSILEIVKCNNNKAVQRGNSGKVHMAEDPDGMPVPKRYLQHKGFDDDGNDMGYIADITYSDGTRIDYVKGTLTIDEKEYPLRLYDNYKTDSNGNMVQNPKGSANEMFKYQWQEMESSDKKTVLGLCNGMKSGKSANLLTELIKQGVDVTSDNVIESVGGVKSPFGKFLSNYNNLNEVISKTSADRNDIVLGEQISKKDFNYGDAHNINFVREGISSTSVGGLNDKSIIAHNRLTGETRSVNGQNNNWDNTYKIYTLVNTGDGTKGLYLGYPQNVKSGAWDNSGNPHNELTLGAGQKFERLLVDNNNGIIIQVPVNE